MTILFSDIADSTRLGEHLDPESVRALMGRYFTEARRIVERHGGTVEKFIGDAVMAVFGVPTLHEDDAVRAVRAAAEIGASLEQLNSEFEARWGVRVGVRTGVNTGEVIAGDSALGHSFVTGDAVNVASRLEQMASEGEVLVGEATYRLTRDEFRFEAPESVALKGKSGPVGVWCLAEVLPPAHRPDTPLVGRQRELAALAGTFERVVEERACRLVTVAGPAGIGKSRLAEELLGSLAARAQTATGRCLPYGTVTYWPAREVVASLCAIADGADLPEVLRGIGARAPVPEAERVAARVAEALEYGAPASPQSAADTFWAFRRLLEGASAAGPLVLVFDDIQWAEPTLLDLLEHLAEFTRDAAMMIVCLTRRELFDRRAHWGESFEVIALERLGGDESAELLERIGGGELPGDLGDRIGGAAEGNPLFLAEMHRMLVDDGLIERRSGAWRASSGLRAVPVPPSINALLAARLDQLGDDERGLLERAAVVGREFGWASVSHLCSPEQVATAGRQLRSLVRRGFLRSKPGAGSGDESFEFAHILMRDVAYEGIPKAVRAELHERLAGWLGARPDADAGEEKLLGYHLEQAYRYRADLGAPDDRARAIAARAAGHLAAAGTRAYAGGDLPAAIDLIDRALALSGRDAPLALRLLPTLGDALCERGELARAERVLTEAIALADRRGARGVRHHAEVLRAYARSFMEDRHGVDELRRVAERALGAFEELGDDAGLARAWQSIAIAHVSHCRWAEVELARRRELWHARRSGDLGMVLRALSALAYALYFGPTPAAEAIAALEPMAAEASGYPVAEATVLGILGALHAMQGRMERARELHEHGHALAERLGALPAAEGALNWADTELRRGDPAAAERLLRRAFETLDRARESAILASVAAALADALEQQGRTDEAWMFCTVSERAADADDIEARTGVRATRARILLRRGEEAGAEPVAREALALARQTDDMNLTARALLALADVLRDRPGGEASAAAGEARALYERKGNLLALGRLDADSERDRTAAAGSAITAERRTRRSAPARDR